MRTEAGLFALLEKILKEADQPMTCNMLYDRAEVKLFAESAHRVSDYLGGLWRKGRVTRSAAPKVEGDNARWAYSVVSQKPGKAPRLSGEESHLSLVPNARSILSKPGIEISENGNLIVIDLPQLTLTIRMK